MPQDMWKAPNLGEHGEHMRAQGSQTAVGVTAVEDTGQGAQGALALPFQAPLRY